MEWKKMFVNDVKYKWSISKICKQLIQGNIKTKTQLKNAEDLNSHLSKGHSYGQQVLEKMCSIINHDEMRNAN